MSGLPADVDTIIVGQGLAGTTLAWTLLRRGARLLLIDQQEPFTASRVAPGLITPITGKRLKLSWQWTEFWPAALDFYRSLEKETNSNFLHLRPAVRLFQQERERAQFQEQHQQGEYDGLSVRELPPNSLAGLHAPLGGFEMQPSGNLDVASYLRASSEVFEQSGIGWDGKLSYDDVHTESASIQLAGRSIHARHLIFCEGWRGNQNPWLRHVDFRPVKGELLRIEGSQENSQRNVHAGKWLSPISDEQYWAGSTYNWNQFDTTPTAQGRAEILNGVESFLVNPVQVLEHIAAVRPAVSDSRPLIGLHAETPWLGFFNGLGTKGVLQAPLMAQRLCQTLLEGVEPPSDVSLNRW